MVKVGRRKGNSKKQTKSNKKSKSVKSSQSKKKRTMKKKNNKIVHKPTYIESLLNQLKKEEPKEQKVVENPKKERTIVVLIHADWCGHCQRLKPEWQTMKEDLMKKKEVEITGEDVREGMIAVISLKMPDPKFSSQTKDKLVSSEARPAVEALINDYFMDFLLANKAQAKEILAKVLEAAYAREAARKAKEMTRRKGLLDIGGLPGKLADCSSDSFEKTELFIVEGDKIEPQKYRDTKVLVK